MILYIFHEPLLFPKPLFFFSDEAGIPVHSGRDIANLDT